MYIGSKQVIAVQPDIDVASCAIAAENKRQRRAGVVDFVCEHRRENSKGMMHMVRSSTPGRVRGDSKKDDRLCYKSRMFAELM